MANRLTPLHVLKDQQKAASDPAELVWLSASAGTGKTHVLTARVLRLLLNGVRPESILCLTFTKAGAAEMAERIHARLAWWVRLAPAQLGKELFALGEAHDEEAQARARRLFARVLDAPGGGLRIQTIHAFCQTLLAGFPAEAGLTPGFRPIEGREEKALARRALAEMLLAAQQGGDLPLIRDIQRLSRRLGEEKAESYLMACARVPDAMAGLGNRGVIAAKLRHALDVPQGDVDEAIVAGCHDDRIGRAGLLRIAAANANWGGKQGLGHADTIAAFLAASDVARATMLDDLIGVAWTKADEPRAYSKKLTDFDPEYINFCNALAGHFDELRGLRRRADLADLLAAALRAGQGYAEAYQAAKRAGGFVDFDDLIRATVKLLSTPGMGDWVRYKLDQATDHILVDEAQDTNLNQWQIVAALAGEFFAGEGARGKANRTIFTVGDFKQAIFGFQGTDPAAFEFARQAFTNRAAEAERDILRLSLDRSFRSTPPVLDLVDRVIEQIGSEQLGLTDLAEPHRSARADRPGRVTLWRPVTAAGEAEEDEGEEGWVDDATRLYATKLARQIKAWLDAPVMLEGKGRPLKAEDILILVRSRATLAALIVARLHAEGVPVAGVDRLRLTAPLAVRDLLAAMRFAIQPDDDLSLAGLLVSPLFGWGQDRLYQVGFARPGGLLAAIRARPDCAETLADLTQLMARADFTTPYRFLEQILTGPMDGRRRLMERLGAEARDPIEELLNAALQFEGDGTVSFQRFLDWFDRGDVEITRDPSAPMDAVRVMTVHGSKGLQAPMVILADATGNPDKRPAGLLRWRVEDGAEAVPVPSPSKTRKEMVLGLERDAMLQAEKDAAEHWRLFYVALTRAEEWLVIGGALGPQAKGVPPPRSWYAAAEQAMESLGAEWGDDPHWREARHYTGAGIPRGVAHAPARIGARGLPPIAEPGWLRTPAPQEARPPRPLAPSSLGPDDVADPPPSPAMRDAAQRGQWLHALFERLPAIPPDRRAEVADHWLARSAGVADAVVRAELVATACAIIAEPAYAAVFGPDALAEAPIAAVVGGDVIAGTVDRLLVGAAHVLVLDFKTGRRVPRDAAALPEAHVRQMAAYVAALEVVFPGRTVSAALLYTAGPRLIDLPADLIARHKPGLQA